MNKADLITPLFIIWILVIIGCICLLLVLPTFILSKVLRTHPGSLILMCCIFEFLYFYVGFLSISDILYQSDLINFDTFGYLIQTCNTLAFPFFCPTQKILFILLSSVSGTTLLILDCYNICLSLDIILIIKNPLYSPARRVKLYHLFSIVLPLIIVCPAQFFFNNNYVYFKEGNIHQKISYEGKIWGLVLVMLSLLMAGILFFVSYISLVISYLEIKKLVMKPKQRRNLRWKFMIYQIFALFYSLCLIIMDLCVMVLSIDVVDIKDYQMNSIFVSLCSTIAISISCIGILPVRLCEPGIARYISLVSKNICAVRDRRHMQSIQNLTIELQKAQTYYAFMYSSLNGQLVESILCGMTSIIMAKIKKEQALPKYPQKRTRYTFHLKHTVRDLLNNRKSSEYCDQISVATSFVMEEQPKQIHQFKNKKELIDIIEYSSQNFYKIRKYFGIKSETILDSIDLESNRSNLFNIGEGEGKSGSFFFFTHDKKYLIKTVSPDELGILKKFLNAYTRQLTSHLGSLLVIMLGIYTLEIKGLVPIHMVLMANSLPNIDSYDMKYIFDIKGSLKNRYVKPPTKGKTLKDLNLLQMNKKSKFIKIPKDMGNKVANIIERDIRFFEKFKIMDYSLLLGIAEKKLKMNSAKTYKENMYHRIIYSEDQQYVYFLAIIDIFQKYNFQKKVEHSIKTLKSKSNLISSIPPKAYADRFYHFIVSNVLAIK